MKNILLFLFAVCYTFNSFAQTNEPEPNREEWGTYFKSTLGQIQTKLYKLALTGKIKPYQNDSFTTYMSLDEFKFRGSNLQNQYFEGNITNNELAGFKPFSPKNILGIWFIQEIKTSPFEINEQTNLSGLALIHMFSYGGLTGIPWPLIHISFSDLKTSLTENELLFITLLYHYSIHNNTIIDYRNSEENCNYTKRINPTWYNSDSLFIEKIVCMLTESEIGLSDYLKHIPDLKVIFNHQKQSLISFSELKDEHYYTLRRIHDEAFEKESRSRKNAEMIIDTFYYPDLTMGLSGIEMDGNKPIQFIYSMTLEKDKPLKFSVSLQTLKEQNIAIPDIWFLEDYFRWKSHQ